MKNLILTFLSVALIFSNSISQNCSFPSYDIPSPANYCLGDTLVLSTGLNPSGLSFIWNTGATTPTISLSGGSAGMFWVQVSDGSCTEGDTVIVGLYPQIGLELGNDKSACVGETVSISANTASGLTYSWSNGSDASSIQVSQSGLYSLTVSNGACQEIDDVRVTFYNYPELDLGPDTFICEPSELTFDLNGQSSAAKYTWYNGATNPKHIMFANKTETIWVKASIATCFVLDSLKITLAEKPTVGLLRDTIMCEGDQLSLKADGNPNWDYRWSNGDSTRTLTTNLPGEYFLTITDEHCSGVQSTRIKNIQVPQVEIDAPAEVCYGEDKIIDATTAGVLYYIWADGSTNPIKIIQSAGQYKVKAYYECGVVADTAVVASCECFVIFPNAFRPTPSGINKTFGPVINCDVVTYKFRVYDREGTLVFETEDQSQFWDGTYKGIALPVGKYTWTCSYDAIENSENISKELSGQVSILR